MKLIRNIIVFIITPLVLLSLVYWNTQRPRVVDVVLQPAEIGVVERTVANTRAGTVTACSRSFLTPSIGGQIYRIPVKEGNAVVKGELLLELWNELHQAEVALTRSQISEARSIARSACVEAESAQREADRLVSLRSQGVASADQTDKAVAAAKASEARCAGAQAGVEVSQGRLAVAEAKLNQTRLFAPFDGIIAKINGDLFQYVTPSPPGIATLPIMELVGTGCYYVAAPIDEVDSPGVLPGMAARITLDAFGDSTFEGQVRRVAPSVQALERQARTVDIEVDFQNPEDLERLLSGYSADVEIILETRTGVVRIPTESILGGNRVFVFEPGTGLLDERRITTGVSNWYHTQVLSGVEAGEQVVTSIGRPGVSHGALARAEPARQ